MESIVIPAELDPKIYLFKEMSKHGRDFYAQNPSSLYVKLVIASLPLP
jgi:hypothetical protein